jgi:hypothetical protein
VERRRTLPANPQSQLHTGTYGLFDDPDETARTTVLAEAHEIHHLEERIRRQERRDRRQDRKEAKAAQRVVSEKSPKSRLSSLLGKIFGCREASGNEEPLRLVGED